VLSPGGGYAYVVEDTTPGNFITIDLSNGIVTNTISLPDCQGLTPAVSPDGKYAYVTNCDTLYVINLATDTVTNSFPISYGSVATIAVSPDGQYVYTLSITCGGSYMDTIDLGNGAVSVTAHPSWGGCSGAMALSPDGHDAYLMVGDELVRVNLLNGVVSNVISGYVTQSIAVSNDGRYAYLVQDNNPGGLVTVDLESDQVTNTIYFPWVGYFNYPNYIAVYTPPSP
jgi:YVTN family beta-propeller protein